MPLDPTRGASESVAERCDNQNQYFSSRADRDFDFDGVQTGSVDPDVVLGGFRFPTLSEGFGGGGEISERRTSGIQNVTMRETKRPKEREKDKEYRRLTLTRADVSFSQFQGRAEVHSSPRTFGGNDREATPAPSFPFIPSRQSRVAVGPSLPGGQSRTQFSGILFSRST